jgi:hypothetical protein
MPNGTYADKVGLQRTPPALMHKNQYMGRIRGRDHVDGHVDQEGAGRARRDGPGGQNDGNVLGR